MSLSGKSAKFSLGNLLEGFQAGKEVKNQPAMNAPDETIIVQQG